MFHTELLVNAYMLAAKAHAGQFRKDGSSQLSHCVMTALQLADMGLDAECVAAGLLHEALRSLPAFRSQMEEFMPSGVVQLVDRVTTISEISQLYRTNRDTLNDEKMRRSEWPPDLGAVGLLAFLVQMPAAGDVAHVPVRCVQLLVIVAVSNASTVRLCSAGMESDRSSRM